MSDAKQLQVDGQLPIIGTLSFGDLRALDLSMVIRPVCCAMTQTIQRGPGLKYNAKTVDLPKSPLPATVDPKGYEAYIPKNGRRQVFSVKINKFWVSTLIKSKRGNISLVTSKWVLH